MKLGGLDAAALDLDAARRLLVDPPNVLAANHLQQAAEKILDAVRPHCGQRRGASYASLLFVIISGT